VNRPHARISCIRRDAMHKLTAGRARSIGVVVVETMHVARMVRTRHLARAIMDTGMAELRRQLAYRTVRDGSKVEPANTFFLSPQDMLPLRGGEGKPASAAAGVPVRCPSPCLDRDENATCNLAALVAAVAGSGSGTLNARRRDVRPAGRRVADEAGSRHRLVSSGQDRRPDTNHDV